MGTFPGTTSEDCAEARRLAALTPDGVLSQVERQRLERHLRHCEQCASFAATVQQVVTAIRSAVPVDHAIDTRAIVATVARKPRRRVVPQSRAVLEVAMVSVAVAVASAVTLSLDGGPRPTEGRLVIVQATDMEAELRADVAVMKQRAQQQESEPNLSVNRPRGRQFE